MPVMHKYRRGNMYYVFTEIQGKIIAFQLTREGEKKIKSAGVFPGKTFNRAILLDLYRSGDAYTRGKNMDQVEKEFSPHQLQFDFVKDPEPETLFPLCAVCAAPADLHLVEIRGEKHFASILCPGCREKKKSFVDTSIPLSLINRGILKRFFEMKGIQKTDASVSNYLALLNAEFKNQGKDPSKKKRGMQEALFRIGDGKPVAGLSDGDPRRDATASKPGESESGR